MKKTLSTYEAADILFNDNNANWSRAGALALIEYLEEYEHEAEEELELDVVAIRCDYSEYNSLQDFIIEYYGYNLESSIRLMNGYEINGDTTNDIEPLDSDEIDELIREYIAERGQLVEFRGGVIVSSF